MQQLFHLHRHHSLSEDSQKGKEGQNVPQREKETEEKGRKT